MNRRWLASRRAVLGGLGGVGLSQMVPQGEAFAQSAVPTRLLVVHVPEGMWSKAQRPVAGAATLGPIFSALDPYKSKINVLNNLNMQSRDHGPGGDGHHRGVPHMFTCTEMADPDNAGGPSVDQKIAAVIGKDSMFGSLQFAVRIVYADTNSRPLWSARSRVVPAMQDPWEAYKRVFGAGTVGASMPTAPKVDLKKSVLDYALAEGDLLRPKLSTSDRDRLDSYQESLRDIERRLGTGTVGSSCAPPMLGTSVDKAAEANYPTIGQLQMDLAVAAMQCGLTRVTSLQWGNSNDQSTYSWLGVNTLGHDLSHNNGNCDPSGSKKLQVYQWYAKQFAYLLGKLDAAKEGTGSMLDNTVVLWASEFSDSNGHKSDKLLWLLMGNANGYFKQGQVLDCAGRSVNDLHTSLCNAFGIADSKFGNPAYCSGPLAGLR